MALRDALALAKEGISRNGYQHRGSTAAVRLACVTAVGASSQTSRLRPHPSKDASLFALCTRKVAVGTQKRGIRLAKQHRRRRRPWHARRMRGPNPQCSSLL
ncbi:hypothetical protein HPP92_028759, partial [Vanilla planifolia]